MNKPILILLVFLAQLSAFSQTDQINSYVLPETIIKLKENMKIVKYEFESEENLFILRDSVLYADTSKYKFTVKLNDINSISVRDGSFFIESAGAGLVLGFLIGIAKSGPEFKDASFLIALPLTLIFGITGALVPDYKTIEFNKSSFDERKSRLKLFMKKNEIKTKNK